MRRVLENDPEKRLSLLGMLNHPFMVSAGAPPQSFTEPTVLSSMSVERVPMSADCKPADVRGLGEATPELNDVDMRRCTLEYSMNDVVTPLKTPRVMVSSADMGTTNIRAGYDCEDSELPREALLRKANTRRDNVRRTVEDLTQQVVKICELPNFGTAFHMRDDAVCVCFNDETRLVLDPSRVRYDYFEKFACATCESTHTIFSKDFVPGEFRNKVDILRMFSRRLEVKALSDTAPAPPSLSVHVHAHGKSDGATVMRLSDGSAQIVLKGCTIVMDRKDELVWYARPDLEGCLHDFRALVAIGDRRAAAHLCAAKTAMASF